MSLPADASDMNGIVLDCSAALALFLDDEQPPLAIALLDVLADVEIWIPSLWHCELANALLVAQRRRRLVPARARQILAQAARLPLKIEGTAADTPARLFELAAAHGLTAYDAAYLDLAQRRALALATLDARLAKAARDTTTEVFGDKSKNAGVREPKRRYTRSPPR